MRRYQILLRACVFQHIRDLRLLGGAWKSSIFWACRITTCNARAYETRELLASLSGFCLMVRRPWAGQNHEGILMALHA